MGCFWTCSFLAYGILYTASDIYLHLCLYRSGQKKRLLRREKYLIALIVANKRLHVIANLRWKFFPFHSKIPIIQSISNIEPIIIKLEEGPSIPRSSYKEHKRRRNFPFLLDRSHCVQSYGQEKINYHPHFSWA